MPRIVQQRPQMSGRQHAIVALLRQTRRKSESQPGTMGHEVRWLAGLDRCPRWSPVGQTPGVRVPPDFHHLPKTNDQQQPPAPVREPLSRPLLPFCATQPVPVPRPETEAVICCPG